jgi:group I intron endonuclease
MLIHSDSNQATYTYNEEQMRNFNPFYLTRHVWKYDKSIFTGFINASVCPRNALTKPHAYILHHPESDKVYIGSSGNFHARHLKHKRYIRNKTHHCKELLSLCEDSDWIEFYVKPFNTRQEALDEEQRLLNQYFGKEYILNTAPNARTQEGLRHSPEAIAKMTATRNRPEMIEASRQRMLGKPNTEEQKRKISESLKGRVISQKNREVTSALFKGVARTDDVKKNIKAGILEKIDPVYCDGKVFESVAEAARQLGVGHSTVLYRIGSKFKPEWHRITKDDPRWLAHLAEQEGKQAE